MRYLMAAATFGAMVMALASDPTTAHACMMQAPIELADIKYADVVIVGRIANYDTIGDPNLITGYAIFDVLVDEILIGDAPPILAVTWDNSTFGEPESIPPGPFLIALRDPRSGTLPLRGPSATIFPNPEPRFLALLQAPCADPFMFPSTSDEALEIRRMLNR